MPPDNAQVFQGASFAEAVQQVKKTLGADAVILEKREIKPKKSLFRLGGSGSLVQIIAAPGRPAPPAKPKTNAVLNKVYGATAKAPAAPAPQPTPPPATPLAAAAPAAVAPALNETAAASLSSIKELLHDELLQFVSAQARGGIPAVGERLLDAYQTLLDNDAPPECAKEIVEEIHQSCLGAPLAEAAAQEELHAAVARRLTVAPPVKAAGPAVIMLAGPCGVGKTTTLVKLAFTMQQKERKKVRLLTEDFSRPGASAQLRNLATILGVEMQEINSPTQLAAAVRRAGEDERLLVDTAGRVPRETERLEDLCRMREAGAPQEMHLVLPAHLTRRAAAATVAAFKGCGCDRIILSKLDESPTYGLALALAYDGALPLSYVTGSVNAARGLRLAQADDLAKLICGASWQTEGP